MTLDARNAPTGDALQIANAPAATATSSLLTLGATNLSGASASGTYIGANPAAANADFINYQVGGVTKFSVDKNGVITGNGSGLTGISGALSGLNPGDVMFAASGTTAGTSGNLAWDNTNYKLTVDSTNVPAGDALQISNAPKASATNALLTLGATDIAGGSASGTYIGANPAAAGADFMNYQVGGTSKFNVDKNGNLITTGGIGINGAPYLDVTINYFDSHTSSLYGGIEVQNLTSNPYGGEISLYHTHNGNPISNNDIAGQLDFFAQDSGFAAANTASIRSVVPNATHGSVTGNLIFSTMSASTLTDRMIIDNAGNVGIGTTSPVDPLSIGTAPAGSATDALVNLTNTALSGASANGTYLGANPASAGADFINYQVGGTTKFSVDKNGVITGNGSGITGIAGAISGMTAGSVFYSGGGSTVSQDNANFFWDGTNHRLGIGTATPAYSLETISSAAYTSHFENTAVGGTAIWADNEAASGGGTSIYATNVSSGVASAAIQLSSTFGYGVYSQSTKGTAGYFQGNSAANTKPTLVTQGYAGATADLFQAQNSGGTVLDRINSSGNVGIGSTAPLDPLSISTAPPSSATDALVNLTDTALSGASASGTYIGANPAAASADFINYQVGGTTQFKVDSGGNLTATSFTGNGSGLTNIGAGSIPWATPGTIGSTTPNTGAFTTLTSKGTTSDSTTASFNAMNSGGNSLLYVRDDGWVGIGTTSPTSNNVNSTVLNIYNPNANYAAFTHYNNGATGSAGNQGFNVGIWTDNNANIWNYNNTEMIFATNSIQRMYILGNGQVGIPTNTPGAQLEIDSKSDTRVGEIVKANSATQSADLVDVENSAGGILVNVSAGGNLGIGTTTPVDLLSLGSVNASATHAELNLSNTALNGGSANGTYIGANPASASADFINYQVNGATKFKVDLNGVITGNGSGLTNLPSSAVTAAGANTQVQFNNANTFGASSDFVWDNTNHKMTLNTTNAPTGDGFQIANAPKGSASNSLLALGATDVAGASANGTYIGANPGAASADFINYQVGGTTKFKVDLNGVITGNGSGLTNLPGGLTVNGTNLGGGTSALGAITTGTHNTALGYQAATAITGGSDNTAIGYQSLDSGDTSGVQNVAVGSGVLAGSNASDNTGVGYQALTANTTGGPNTAIGYWALKATTTGQDNVAVGYEALFANTGNGYNTAVGDYALASSTASNNTAVGYQALNLNTSGTPVTGMGYEALKNNTTGSDNVGVGYQALLWNQTGNYNTAVGDNSLANTTSSWNTSMGYYSLQTNTSGSSNSAFGFKALQANSTGSGNTAMGWDALFANTAGGNTAVGYSALAANTSGNPNTGVGYDALSDTTTGSDNVGLGYSVLLNNTTGNFNTAVGDQALLANNASKNSAFGYNALYLNSSGSPNTAVGYMGAYNNTTGTDNVAMGYQALYLNSTGSYNVAVGDNALDKNTASNNSALGYQAAYSNTSGTNNTAVGYEALYTNSTGSSNTAMGYDALTADTGGNNAAFGYWSMLSNTNGSLNAAFGDRAMVGNTSGSGNVAVGDSALYSNSTGGSDVAIGAWALNDATSSGNTAVGYQSLQEVTSGSNNTAIGMNTGYNGNSLTTGSNDTFIGYTAGSGSSSVSNATAIGANATVSESNAMVLGGTGVWSVSVGIGTATPGYTLDVENGSAGSTVAYFYDGTDNCTVIPNSGVSCSRTCGSRRMFRPSMERWIG